MALRFESEPASVIGRPQVARFVVESGLLTAFLEVGWYWDSRWLGLHKLLHIPTITPASALAAAVLFILFLALVFYGTSGQVTPLRLVRVPTFDFFFKPIRDSSTVLKERKRTASGRETTELGKDLELEIATKQASAKAESCLLYTSPSPRD